MLVDVPADERSATWRLAFPDGRLVGYGTGAVELLRAMRRARPLPRALGLVPAHVLDRAYHAVAQRRSKLGRFVPDRPGPIRFP